MSIARSVNYAVRCEKCSHRTPKTVAWLSGQNKLPCEECGAIIDLRAGDNAVVITELANQCARIDATLAKRQ